MESDGVIPVPQDVIIFGATGDLARSKLLPGLYRLCASGGLPPQGRIIGAARGLLSNEGFARLARESVEGAGEQPGEREWRAFEQRLSYVTMDDDGYESLEEELSQERRLIYLALPASAFAPVVRALQERGFNENANIVIEKPFGSDLESARELNALLHGAFDERNIFRIDHYLGKETVQNILVLRFGNAIFERLWNRDVIDHVEITVAESEGIEGRGAFYEETGALRDIVQNHVLQMLALLMMEPPVAPDAEAIRDEKLKLLRAVHPISPSDVIRGQYTAGVIDGEEVPAYRDEANVNPESDTETFAALKLTIDNWRWADVPIFLRTGKRLPKRLTEAEVAFKRVPLSFFQGTGMNELPENRLTINIQPQGFICVSIVAKAYGPELLARPAELTFSYSEGQSRLRDAYEVLLAEALRGDSTLFVRDDSIERAWEVLEPVLRSPPPLCFYPAGSWGPAEADDLIAPYRWHVG